MSEKQRKRTRFKCAVCGKITAGRLPRVNSRHYGDGTARYPRRHNAPDRIPCIGNIIEAEWVDVPAAREERE